MQWLRRRVALMVILTLLVLGAGVLLGAGKRIGVLGGRSASARLLSVEPIPEMPGEMCEYEPASATASLFEALQEGAAPAPAAADDKKREEMRTRKPLRTIRDNYSSFSSVAVDPQRNEVVMTDESMFQILVYDRMTNTPPGANFSEPKRMIGGLDTKADYVCGLYIDRKSTRLNSSHIQKSRMPSSA